MHRCALRDEMAESNKEGQYGILSQMILKIYHKILQINNNTLMTKVATMSSL